MALIGLLTASVVAMIVFVRSAKWRNKAATLAIYAVAALYSFGVSV